MTSLPYSFYLRYLTVSDGLEWRQLDWDSRNIVAGLKGDAFKGHVNATLNGVKRQFTMADIEELLRPILKKMGEALRAHVPRPVDIVPIPGTSMVVSTPGPFRILDLAEMVAAGYGPGAYVYPALRWAAPRAKARKTAGHRTPEMYEPHLRVVMDARWPVVLFDDVLTSGSQMIAGARTLRAASFNLVRGLVAAKVTRDQSDPLLFGERHDALELDPPPFDLNAFISSKA